MPQWHLFPSFTIWTNYDKNNIICDYIEINFVKNDESKH